ncbi:hypothetical protein pipiens_001020, partial [Culex pipiens pipiens]
MTLRPVNGTFVKIVER